MRAVDVFISHANVDKPLVKIIIEALLRDGFAVFVDRPEDKGLGFSADEIAYWRDKRNRLWHLRPAVVTDYDYALRNQIKEGARAVLGCLCTPLKAGQDHFGDELLLAVTDHKLLLCRLGEHSPNDILANKGGLGRLGKVQVLDARKIAPLASLLPGRGLEDDADWPEPTDEAQRQALDQYKIVYQELTHKLRDWKLGSLSAYAPEALTAYTTLLRAKLVRLTPAAKVALIDALRERNMDPSAEALCVSTERFVDLAMNIEPASVLDAFAKALEFLEDQHAPETDAQGLRVAAHSMVPLISHQSDTERVRLALNGASVDVIEARVGSGTMAEVLMAAAERKASEFRPRRTLGDKPLGRRAITLGAEAGPEDGEARDVAALILDLHEMKGVTIDVSRVNARVKKVLEKHYGVSLSEQEMRNRLERDKKMNRRRYYLIAEKPTTPAVQDYLSKVLRQVRAAAPELVAITTDPTLRDKEDELLQSVLDVIELEGGKG